MYAVVQSGGKQYKVEPGALVTVGLLTGDPGSAVTFDGVLLVADGDRLETSGAGKVTAEIVSHGKGEKIHVFRYKNKTRSRKLTGSRAKNTTIKITGIEA
ncbi:MAG: 50S ribosomal protein L21 [Chloroflexi bacterium]|nr:50S ribosomal protein L21 [Chloroflexota bacterium]